MKQPKPRLSQPMWLFLPGILAMVSALLGLGLVRLEWVVPQVLAAALLTLPHWLGALWIPWALVFGGRFRRAGCSFRSHAHSRSLFLSTVVSVLLGIALSGIPPALRERLSEPPPPDGFTLITANVNAYHHEPSGEAVGQALAELGADLVIILERRPEHIPGMVRVADNFDVPLERESHRTAVFCRPILACQAEVTEEFGSDDWQMPLALVRIPAHRLCVMGVHVPPPVPFDARGVLPYIDRVAGALEDGRLARAWGPCQRGDGAVVAGDLNSVPFSPAATRIQARGLRDGLLWAGIWGASWPAGGGWPDLPFFQLDHAFFGQVRAGPIRLLRIEGTDHKALMVRVGGILSSD